MKLARHLIGSNMHTIRRAHAESTHNTLRYRWYSFRIRSGSLISVLIRYELVLVSFQIHFQFVMFSPDEHIRRIFVCICANSSFVKFLPFVHGTLPQLVLKSVRTQINSFSFWSIRTHRFGQFVLIWSIRTHCSVNSYSFWAIRPQFGQLVLMFLVNSFSFWDLYFGIYASVSVNGTTSIRYSVKAP